MWGCTCREERIDKEEKERLENEKRIKFEHRQQRLDDITNNEFLRGGEMTFEKLKNPDDKSKLMRDYLKNLDDNLKRGKSYGLMGRPGTGKTTLMICLHKELIKRGVTSAMINAHLFFPKLDGMGFSEKESKIEAVMKAGVLFFDDVFALEEYSPAKRELINRIAEYRDPPRMPIFLGSNIYHESREEVAKIMVSRLGGGTVAEAIVDRILNKRMGIINFVGKSFRQGE